MKKIVVVATSFHKKEIEIMLREVLSVAKKTNLKIVETVWVPGSLETPLALKKLLSQKNIDGAVVLGIIERGETKHGLVMGISVLSAIIQLQLELGKPIGVGILGPEILPHQIAKRLRPYAKDALSAVNAMLDLG